MRNSRFAVAAVCALALPGGATAEPVPLCSVGYSIPRITAADLAAVSDVAIVDVAEIAEANLECRVKGVIRAVERGSLYSAGQKIEFRLNCAGEGATLRYPNSPWLYSDLPVTGTPGLIYQDVRFTPPGPHFLNIRPAGTQAAAATATAGESRSLC